MNILVLTWEYPPKPGKTSELIREKTHQLAGEGNKVFVVACDDWRKNIIDKEEDIIIYHAGSPIEVDNPLMWVLTISNEIERLASNIIYDEKIDLIIAHEWITFPAGISLKKAFNIPLLTVFHSTESIRTFGMSDPYIEAVKKIEWQAQFEASKVLTYDGGVYNQLRESYGCPEYKLLLNPASIKALLGEVSSNARFKGSPP